MGSVKITDSIERVGESTVTKVEYEFESYEDFASWQADKNKALTDAITSLTGGYGGDTLDEPMFADIQVKKKEPIKH
jgi:hypothetical protein